MKNLLMKIFSFRAPVILTLALFSLFNYSVDYFQNLSTRLEIDATSFDVPICLAALEGSGFPDKYKPKSCSEVINYSKYVYKRKIFVVYSEFIYLKSSYIINLLLNNGRYFYYDPSKNKKKETIIYFGFLTVNIIFESLSIKFLGAFNATNSSFLIPARNQPRPEHSSVSP